MISSIYGVVMGVVLVIAGICGIIGYVLKSLGKMKCMQKAGEAGWKAWIPVYNDFVMYKLTGVKCGLIAIEILYVITGIIYVCMTLSFTFGLMNDLDKSVEKSYSSLSNYSYSTGNTTSSKVSTKNTTRNTAKTNSTKNNTANGVRVKSAIDTSSDLDLSEYMSKGIGMIVVEIFYTIFAIGLLVVNIFFAIYIAKSYGLGGGYIAGMILVPTIFIMIIGFGKSQYKGTYQSVKAQQ